MKQISLFIVAGSFAIFSAFPVQATAQAQVQITILYDNYLCNQSALADWGFSCIVKGLEKTILFDAGAIGTVLSSNVNTLGVNLNEVELAMVSHDHSDHTGGLTAALVAGSKATVYIGSKFSTATEQVIKATGATADRTSAPVNLLPTVQTTGEVAGSPYEQGLMITTDSGLVVILGCSHPGVIEMLTRVKQLLNKNIYMVLGGFHWLNFSDTQVNTLIQSMKDLGVKKCGATHCTGDRAIALIRQAFGSDFVEMGVGRVITLSSAAVGVREDDRSNENHPQSYQLEQNYSNPFNPTTTICFSLPQLAIAKLQICDLLGREVAVLVNEEKPAGRYSVTWDAPKASSGIYFYTLTAGALRETRRMMLIR